MKTLVWRILAVVTTLFLVFLAVFFYGSIGYGSGIDWTYEVVVLTYHWTVIIGLIFWHQSTRRRPAAPLFRISAWITFLLPALLLIGWTGWVAGFGDAFVSTLNHVGLAAVPAALVIFAYLIFYRSIRFAWMNVLLLSAVVVLQLVITLRSSASLGQAFSSFSFDDMVIGIIIAVVAAVLALINFLAIRKVPVYKEAEPAAQHHVPLWWGLAVLALLVSGVNTFAVTERAVIEIGQDGSRDWSDTLYPHIESGDLAALQKQLEERRLGITIAPKALVAAVGLGQAKAMVLLIEAGANPEGETIIHYQTALSTAAKEADAQIVQTLLDHGADPDHGGKVYVPEEGRYVWFTPLSAAVTGAKPQNVAVLIAAGATPDLRDGDALMWAARLGDLKSANMLLSAGANPDLQDPSQGMTPLHYAATYGQIGVYNALLSAGANPDMQDQRGRVAEDLLGDGKDAQR